MNNKLHLSNLITELAKRTQKKDDVADNFLRELFALIEEALLNEQLVKIKEIGTFKLQLVNARRIANIQTGESQEIAEHYKVVFTPDKRLASLVNEPYRHLSSVEIYENGDFKIIENSKDENNEANDTNDSTEGEIQQLIDSVANQTEKNASENTTPQSRSTIVLPKMNVKTLADLYLEDETSSQEQEKHEVKEVLEEKTQQEQNRSLEEKRIESETNVSINNEEQKTRKKKPGLIIVSALLLTAAALSYYYITHHRVPSNQIFQVVIGQPTPEEIADSIKQAEIDSIKKSIITKQEEDKLVPLDTLKYSPTKYLTQISRQYYGNKYFWVYIYEENKDKIEDFNNVKRGTLLVIPAPQKYGINSEDSTSLNKAKQIGAKLVLEREERMKRKK